MTKFVKLSIAALALVGISATAGTLEDTKKTRFC
jgi:general L-amino acid transport system substrate-binding protein